MDWHSSAERTGLELCTGLAWPYQMVGWKINNMTIFEKPDMICHIVIPTIFRMIPTRNARHDGSNFLGQINGMFKTS